MARRARDHARVRELPSGTVTMLFTDIEGSTRLLHELGERYADVLADHRRVLRGAFSQNGGVEVDTQGDAFFFVFLRASDAVAAAREAQAALGAGLVSVRMGIHTGEPVVTHEGYVGADVHRAARIMAAGHGGQVVVSEATRQLLDTESTFRDLGEHRLKDLGAPQRLYQVGDDAFPPLRTLYQTNLPVQPSALVGREQELAEAGALLRAHRLLTLTGPGGSGKTRLGLQLAAEALEQFPDGVFWVPLQALRDPALVERAIAGSVGAEGDLHEHVANKALLVLLDNFEQIVEAAPTVSSLLAATPSAKVLVTSREPLRVEFEHRYPVEPLPEHDAEVLFIERACSVAPSFRPTPSVGEICRRLDGLPLAIELASARTALLDPEELLLRLEQRLPLLASQSRDAPARQRTLRATIEWSYELLDAEEQDLFRRLAVFRGSFLLGSAEVTCAADIETMESLVVKSLVRRWSTGRLGMLDTIREYALELLDTSTDAEDLRRRHAEHFLAVAVNANLNAAELRPGGQRLDLAFAEQDNFRGALAWTIRSGSISLGLEIATALEQLWVTLDPTEGCRWFERLFDRPEAELAPPSVRGQALRAYGSSLHIAGHLSTAEEKWLESLEIFDQLDDEHGRAVLMHRLGISSMLLRGDLERARELVEASDMIHERLGDAWGRAQTTGTLGAVARDQGDERTAIELVRQSAGLARDVGVVWWESGALAELACLLLNAGLVDEGEARARESLMIADALRDRPGRIFGVGIFAWLAAARGQAERAGRLWAAIEDDHSAAPLGGWRRHRDSCDSRLRDVAGSDFDRGRAEGRTLSLEDAVALALSSATSPPG
jgi:predicted ATPase/class 3 adenylate cyclase